MLGIVPHWAVALAWRLTVVTCLALFVTGECFGAEPAVVVAEDEPVVIVTDEQSSSWPPSPAVVERGKEGEYFLRPINEAFVDPDRRDSLEVKYYFPLSDFEIPPLNLNRSEAQPGRRTLALASDEKPDATVSLDVESPGSQGEAEWIDYKSAANQHTAAVLLTGRPGTPSHGKADAQNSQVTPTLQVVELEADPRGWKTTKTLARRNLQAAELPERWLPGGLIDAWDFPPELGRRASFVGRVIAVLKKIDDRYAIDLYGDKLHPDSDCRIWLSDEQHEWGRPVGIRFVDIDVCRENGTISKVAVLGVIYEDRDGEQTAVGLDFPICRSPTLEQLRRLAGPNTTLDARKLVGDDLADELSRRLVDGLYH